MLEGALEARSFRRDDTHRSSAATPGRPLRNAIINTLLLYGRIIATSWWYAERSDARPGQVLEVNTGLRGAFRTVTSLLQHKRRARRDLNQK